MNNTRIGMLYAFFLMGVALFIAVTPVKAGDLSAHNIMEKNFFVMKVRTLSMSALMTLITESGGVRERKLDMLMKLQKNGTDSNIVIRFLYPPDVKGTGFLQIEVPEGDDNMWVYLPALHKSRRLVSNNKKDSFFGSDFSNGDILPPKVDLYRHTIIRSEMLNGNECYVIESVPKDEKEKRNFGYGKKLSWIRKDNFLENRIEYYDTAGQLLKTQNISEHINVDPKEHKWIPKRREIVNHQTKHKTILVQDNIQVGIGLSDAAFTTRALEREWRK